MASATPPAATPRKEGRARVRTPIQRSLFGEMLDWMLVPLLLLWPVSVTLTWLVAQSIASRPHDRELEHLVHALSRHVVRETDSRGRPLVRLTVPASALLSASHGRREIQVRGLQGELVLGNAALPPPDPPADGQPVLPSRREDINRKPSPLDTVQWRDEELGDTPLRVAHLWLRDRAVAGEQVPLVQVAEALDERALLATEILKGVLLPQYAVLPLAVLLVWMALSRGLAPLESLQQRIRARRSQDLSPIEERDAPEEVAPLVRSINDLLTRLDRSVATQKRFLADAAHQLKTPLAGLRMQAELAQREMERGGDVQSSRRSLQQIAHATQNATRMVNQLLAMARAEDAEQALRRHWVDLSGLAAEVVRDFVPRALDKRIDLGYEGPAEGPQGPEPVLLHGQPVLLRELLRNLVDNALLYTPEGGSVTVRVLHDPYGQVAVLQVEDTGVGIAEAERELVFQPFYRALGTQVDGSGLGLTIVREIVDRHGATLAVEDARSRHNHPTPGTRFVIRFASARRQLPATELSASSPSA